MIFDFNDSDFILPLGNDIGMTTDGKIHMRLDRNFSMDMDSGDVHFNSDWNDKNDDNDFNNSDFNF